MTTETVLTKELIDELYEKYLWGDAQFIGAGEVTVEGEEEFARAIEQAVLQSAEIQALREDAERYQWLRDKSLTYSGFQADGVDGWIVMRRDSSLRRVFSYTNTDLDDAVDAAMEKQK